MVADDIVGVHLSSKRDNDSNEQGGAQKKPPLDNKVAAREKVLTESNIALTQGAPRIKWPELSYQAVGKSSA
jgi:hypothetical protein